MSKAMARSGVIRVCDRGMSSSGDGSSSSHRENQFESSSLIGGNGVTVYSFFCC